MLKLRFFVPSVLVSSVVFTPAAADGIHVMPARDGVSIQSIFGSDDRFFLDWTSRPFRAIVRLLRKDGSFICSGSIVGSRSILTSAHCTRFQRGRFAGEDGAAFAETADGKRYRVTRTCVAPEYSGRDDGHIDLTDITPDVAILKTGKRIGSVTGWFEVSTRLRDGDPVLLAGFHDDAPESLQGGNCVADKWWSPFVFDRISHRCDVRSGSSGSPLLVRRGGSYEIVGVHSASDNATGYASYIGGEALVRSFIYGEIARDFEQDNRGKRESRDDDFLKLPTSRNGQQL